VLQKWKCRAKSASAKSESVEKCSKSESVEPKVQVPKVEVLVFFLMGLISSEHGKLL
jgi:hypothetical protein